MRRSTILAAIALLVGTATLAVAQDLAGSIRGRVMDSAGGPVADAAVTLAWGEGDAGGVREAVTSADGRYEFLDLPVDDELAFALETEIDGVPVKREDLTLSTWTPEMVYDLTRADTASDPADIQAGLTVVLPPTEGGGQVEVIEFLDITNNGDSPYTETDHDGAPIGLHVHMPQVAHAVSVQGEELQTRMDSTGLSIVDPIKPGRTLVTISYHFESAQTVDLSRSMHAALTEVRVLAGNPAYTVTSPSFTRGEPATIHGESYITYQRGPAAPHTLVDIKVRRGSAPASSGVTARPSGAADTGSVVLLLLVGAISLMAGGAIGAWVMQSRRSGPAGAPVSGGFEPGFIKGLKASDLMALKDAHLEMIAQLDEQKDSKALSAAAHSRVRDEYKARLGVIMERLGG
ncbi:carboxypeptidase regulatory-like domain-containing protein [Candidatus Poribacteria bacterium]|jgi:hypothetical protein|nr:carboxypeptidase regulatory-like domain-containing protein [Candidatus Poribacteria bacterium]MBT5532918.1 carboxypeptidase regulatory-like domain-containing protein [Candidatus Poribacteria bacterium]MBT5713036.1 carboxypeptidase regulatory-like domain-containing protein [Candidatus Poribacteria bacterium]MBT7100656.1 carboxypeptidase regulatory-like domain-containing protein [Candidatus Poribacteria bacterium]MBT7808579.1 carboxypeptidase regulatory-like domain-containing protein [Candidat